MGTAKIVIYATRNHTDELIKKILDTYHDNLMNADKKKDKIVSICTAVSIRNIKKTSVKSVGTALNNHTRHLVEKIEQVYNDSSMTEDEKKKKYRRYCLAIALRNNMGGFIDSFKKKADKNAE